MILTYRRKNIDTSDIHIIKKCIKDNPMKSRRWISQELCRIWDWRQDNGTLKDMVCRSLLTLLEKNGYIVQPPKKCSPPNPLQKRTPPIKITVDDTLIQVSLKQLAQIEIRKVRNTKDEQLYNSLIHQFHYLSYTHPIGESIKYMAFVNNRPVGCCGWTSPAWYIKCRDQFIGWSHENREKNLRFIAYNTRYLILPWIKVKFLASHLLSTIIRRISKDWEKAYNHPLHYLETFVDSQKFIGSTYKASNWIFLGQTKGLGKLSKTNRIDRSLKDVYGYPLSKNFREVLCR
ncbi:MAG: DUF4338 domain-containing protein [Clostridiaceae bacterium]|nr:DUF4338 domain-containing protein [Clostridiaceae bacterium]